MLCLPSCGFITDGAAPAGEGDHLEPDVASQTQDTLAIAAPQDCLAALWEGQHDPDREFDRTHDLANGGSISCATGTTPREFEAMLRDIRHAAQVGDRAALLRELEMPLLYIDNLGERRDMSEAALIEQHFDEIFAPEMIDLLKRIELSDMTVVPEQGGFFELGSVWLVVTERGGRPRLRTVNRQALNEAILSAAENRTPQHSE